MFVWHGRCMCSAGSESTFIATVKQLNAAGWMVTGERTSEEDDDVPVELSQERDRMLRLKQRDEVFVIPRDMRVFAAAENAP